MIEKSKQLQNNSHKQAKAPITSLHGDVAKLIAFDYLARQSDNHPRDAARLARTCRFFHEALKPELDKIKATTLVQCVVYGDKDGVKAMLDLDANALLLRATVIDYSGRIIEDVTVFEAALGAGDDDMAQMIAPYFTQLKSDDADFDFDFSKEYLKQYNKQMKDLPTEKPYNFCDVITAISSSSDEDITAQLKHIERDSRIYNAIKQFRADFKPDVITCGPHFNSQNLINALEVMKQQWKGWSQNARDLFWRQVFGYIQRSLPACDAQAFAQSIDYIIEEKESLKRSFVFRDDREAAIFPLVWDSGLGFDYAGSTLLAPRPRRDGVLFMAIRTRKALENYMAKKRQTLSGLANAPLSHHPTPQSLPTPMN